MAVGRPPRALASPLFSAGFWPCAFLFLFFFLVWLSFGSPFFFFFLCFGSFLSPWCLGGVVGLGAGSTPVRGRSGAGWFAGLGVVLAVLGSRVGGLRVGGLHVSVVYSPSSVVVAFLYISVPDEFYLFFCL